VQVVRDGRPPVQEAVAEGLRQALRQHHRVAVVVVRRVLAPVDERAAGGPEPEAAGLRVEVHHAVAPVHLEDGRDERDDVGADGARRLALVDARR
jgi:hypothetical protein